MNNLGWWKPCRRKPLRFKPRILDFSQGATAMVAYIRSDLDFHPRADQDRRKARRLHRQSRWIRMPRRSTGSAWAASSVPFPPTRSASGCAPSTGTYNNLLPGQEQWGAADLQFPELLDPAFRPAENVPAEFRAAGPARRADHRTLRRTTRVRWSSTRACAPSPT